MLTKHVPPPSSTPAGRQVWSRLLDAMGVKFLRRLLKTSRKKKRAVQGSQGDAFEGAVLYERLALSVMSVFCGDAVLSPKFVETLPLVLEVLGCEDQRTRDGLAAHMPTVVDASACVAGMLAAKCRIPVRPVLVYGSAV